MARPHLTPLLWGLWLASALGVSLWLGLKLTGDEDRRLFMPGPLTRGHHQLDISCETCHRSPAEEGGSAAEAMQQACMDCHGETRVKPNDTHPRSKFTDPRNADRLQNIDVLHCATCHTEHRPEITHSIGYTRPDDFCFYCHAKIGEERETHAGLGFETCRSAGCHNFHNNRALYTDFLIKHLDDKDLAERPRVPDREYAQVLDQLLDYPRDRYPVRALTRADMDAPAEARSAGIEADWLATAHARSGVNCSACHRPEAAQPWSDRVDHWVCANCHETELKGFEQGLHGMRLQSGLPPMSVAEARLPMQADASHRQLDCLSCHGAHRFDVAKAAVEACLGCHADEHSLAYRDSVHYRLWRQEVAGELPPGSGVSCATCHMPRVNQDVSDWFSRIVVQHNQSATLQPNEKMIRPACLHCHGLGFSIDSLADRRLIDNNFQGRPSVHVKSMQMADSVKRKSQEETGGELF